MGSLGFTGFRVKRLGLECFFLNAVRVLEFLLLGGVLGSWHL